jgi:hypothetical protein
MRATSDKRQRHNSFHCIAYFYVFFSSQKCKNKCDYTGKRRKSYQMTVKYGCSAQIRMREIIKFPGYKVRSVIDSSQKAYKLTIYF